MKGTGKRNHSETRQAVGVLSNIMARSRNQCCRWKTKVHSVLRSYMSLSTT